MLIPMSNTKVFPCDLTKVSGHSLMATTMTDTDLWHLRYGHLNNKGMRLLTQAGMVSGLPPIEDISFCESCIYGKQFRRTFPVTPAWRASTSLELVHSDICGPMNTLSLGGNKYFFIVY